MSRLWFMNIFGLELGLHRYGKTVDCYHTKGMHCPTLIQVLTSSMNFAHKPKNS